VRKNPAGTPSGVEKSSGPNGPEKFEQKYRPQPEAGIGAVSENPPVPSVVADETCSVQE
jgi:hypothetical protein